MIHSKSLTLVVLMLAAVTGVVQAGEAEVKKTLAKVFGVTAPDSIGESVIPGVYEVVLGSDVVYVTQDGKYALQGDIVDIEKRSNLTENVRSVQRQKVVKKIDPSTLIIFKPEKTKHVVTVFTDIDCGYCQKLHREIKQYTDLGIEIRYAGFPRSGLNTPSYFKAVTVWCSEDKQKALTESKSGKALPKKDCKNPVQSHMALAEQFGVSGTPTLVFESGTVIPGYMPAKQLLAALEQDEQRAAAR